MVGLYYLLFNIPPIPSLNYSLTIGTYRPPIYVNNIKTYSFTVIWNHGVIPIEKFTEKTINPLLSIY